MRNRLHVLSFCQQQALAGIDDPKFILKAVQAEFAAESPDGGVTHCGVSREDIKGTSEAMIRVVAEAAFRVERRRLELDCDEGMLRADMLLALDKLPLENPRDVRDLYEVYRQVASQTGEASLRNAIEHLKEGNLTADVDALLPRVEALYPTPAVDDEAPAA